MPRIGQFDPDTSSGAVPGNVPGLINNLKSSNTSVFRRMVAGARSGTQRSRLLVVGMSTEAGAGALNAALYTANSRSKSWPMQLAARLNAAGISANADYICGGGNSAAAALPAFDNRVAFTNTAEYLGARNLGGPMFQMTAVSGVIVFTPANAFDRVMMLAARGGTNSPVTIAGSAGGNGVIATNGSAGIAAGEVAVTAGSTSATLTAGAGTGAFPFVIGTRDSTKPSIEVINAGWGAASSADWAGTVGTSNIWLPTAAMTALLDGAALNGSIAALDINDAFFNIPIETFRANLYTVLAPLRAAGDLLLKLSPQVDTGQVSQLVQDAYWQVVIDVALDLDVPYIDMRVALPSRAAALAQGVSRDVFHQTAMGYAIEAQVVFQALTYFA